MISTVVMLIKHKTEKVKTVRYLKSCCVLQDHYDDECDKIVFHNTTQNLQDQDHSVQDQDQDQSMQDQDQDWFFLVSDRSRPKTDGLRPHHWHLQRRKRSGYCELSVPTMAELFTDADDILFTYTFKQKPRCSDIITWKTSTGLLVESQNS